MSNNEKHYNNYDMFDKYFENESAKFYKNILNLELKQYEFISTIKKEYSMILEKIKKLENSKAPEDFIKYIYALLDFGTHSPWWYLIEKNQYSLIFLAPEIYLIISRGYIIAREWLLKLELDNMI